MNCPHCNSEEKSNVKETRLHGEHIARRRECSTCGKLFTTRESVATDLRIADERAHAFFKRKTPKAVPPTTSNELFKVWK